MDRHSLFLAQTQEGCDLGRFHKSMPNSHTINSRCKLPNVELLGARDDRDACRHDLQKHHQLMEHCIVPNILEKRGRGTLMGGGEKDGLTADANGLASQDILQEVGGAWEVVTRTAPPQLQWGLVSTWRWTAVDDAVVLELNVVPEGLFPEVLPRLGVTFELPKVERVEWFGTGPNEAYVDTREAAAVGKYSATVAELQTPYVRPQENGHRIDTRWATFDGLRVEAIGTLFGLTVRDWTTQALETASHTADLVPGETSYITLDIAQSGVGTAACGPALPDRDKLTTAPATLAVRFTTA